MNPDNIPESPATRKLRLFLESIGEKRGEARGEAKGEARGEAKGRAASLLLVLEQRGLPVTKAERARIRECKDPDQLDTWLKRALTARSVADVLVADPPAVRPTRPQPSRRAPTRSTAPRTTASRSRNGARSARS